MAFGKDRSADKASGEAHEGGFEVDLFFIEHEDAIALDDEAVGDVADGDAVFGGDGEIENVAAGNGWKRKGVVRRVCHGGVLLAHLGRLG